MKKQICVALMASLFLGSCGEEGSVDGEGYCTQRFVDDYNSIINQLKELNSSRNPAVRSEKLRGAVEACDTFFSRHANVTCVAHLSDEQEKKVSSEALRKGCNNLRNSAKI